MRGEILAVWKWTWDEIWAPLSLHDDAPPDLFCELYREISGIFNDNINMRNLAEIISNRELFME